MGHAQHPGDPLCLRERIPAIARRYTRMILQPPTIVGALRSIRLPKPNLRCVEIPGVDACDPQQASICRSIVSLFEWLGRNLVSNSLRRTLPLPCAAFAWDS